MSHAFASSQPRSLPSVHPFLAELYAPDLQEMGRELQQHIAGGDPCQFQAALKVRGV